MKNYALIFTFFSFFISFSQNNREIIDADPNNEISLYFKKEVKKKLLKTAVFQTNKNNITLSFYVNFEGKPYNINVNSFASLNFNKAVIKAFKKYPLTKLSLNSLDTRNKYSLQIVTKKGNKNIFNCSNALTIETPPICEACNNLNYYPDIKTCLNLDVMQYFYQKADFSILDKLKEEEIDLYIQFSVTKTGQLKMTNKTKAPVTFLLEVDKVLSSYPNLTTISYKNAEPIKSLHSFNTLYKKGETPKLTNKEIKYDSLFKRNTTNELAQFYIDKLTSIDLNMASLSRIKIK